MLYVGCVESRDDNLKLGRCKVRIVGLHTHDKNLLKTDDLPWAHPVGSISSANVSGIGISPTGLVEGSWVLIAFADEDQQQPLMLGTLGGIPQQPGIVDVEPDTMSIVDEDGEFPEGTDESVTGVLGKEAKSYTTSTAGLNLIKSKEKKRLTAYKDTNGIWTIGYGLTKINGNPVVEGQTITDSEADKYFLDYVNEVAAPDVWGAVKTPITQSMFDALVSFAYNLGGPKFRKSTVLAQLNEFQYLSAAGEFTTYTKDASGNILNGLIIRRDDEKTLFLRDGVPGSDLVVKPVAIQKIRNDNPSVGFADPNRKYPLWKNEPDTSRLARHEQIEKTSVRKKELKREKNVITAGGKVWNQSPIPYNAKYPLNHVYETESGHIFEFDDTPNSERINLYHRSGTFTEIDANGTQVNRIVGDSYEIIDRNGYIYVKGGNNITVDGVLNLRVNNATNIEVVGNASFNVYNDALVNVSGSANINVKETLSMKANKINIEANELNIDVDRKNETISDDCHIRYDGDLHTHIGADTYNRHDSGTDYSCPADPTRSSDIDCSSVDKADSTGLGVPVARQSVEELREFPTQTVITRGAEARLQYETPEDGDPTEYIATQVEKGTIDPDEEDNTAVVTSVTPPKVKIPTKGSSCDIIFNTEKFDMSFQLSRYFTLGSLASFRHSPKPIKPQVGLSVQELVCNLKGLAENCLDPIKDMYPNMIIRSGLRSPNSPKHASKNSQHNYGQAADFHLNGYSRTQHYEAIQRIQAAVPYDQLILEYGGGTDVWIHISFKYQGNRNQELTLKNHTTYNSSGFTLIA